MTLEELLAQLRDIHLPLDAQAGSQTGFAVWPIAVFVVIWLGVLALGYWRRNAWRRRARAELRNIAKEHDLAQRWSRLLSLAESMARIPQKKATLPDAAYRRADLITEQDAAAMSSYLSVEARR